MKIHQLFCQLHLVKMLVNKIRLSRVNCSHNDFVFDFSGVVNFTEQGHNTTHDLQ